MKDIALNLYRKWYRFRHPAQDPLRPDDSEMPRSRRIKAALDNGDFKAAEDWANALMAFPHNEREDEVFKGLGALMSWLRAYGKQPDVFALLQEWQNAFPESLWPARLDLLYWGHAASERRGQDSASNVSEAQWQDAWVIGQVLFLKGIALLGQGMDWFVAHELGRHAQVFNEPEWAIEWCRGQVVAAEHIPNLQELKGLASPLLLEEWGFAQVEMPTLPAERPDAIISAVQQVSSEAPSGFFWLMVGLHDSPYGYYHIHNYAFLRTERWGGDDGEILTIAGSPLCQHLTEDERQNLRSIQWQDEVSSIIFEDPEMRDVDKRARKALKRGDLSPEAHSQMLCWIHCCLHERWPKALQETPLYQWRLLHSMRKMLKAGKAYQVDSKLDDALCYRVRYGYFPDELTELLVPICHYGAPYAALYGVFCDNGWGGLKQNHEVAQQWYAYAVKLCPPDSRFGDMDYGIFTQLKKRFGWDDFCGPLWNVIHFLANAGYADAQMRIAGLYGEDERRRDLPLSVKWYRAALRVGQPDTYKTLYYIGTTYIGEMIGVDPSLFPKTTPLSRSAYGMDAYLEFLELMAAHPIDNWTPDQADFVNKTLFKLRYTIALWPDHHAAYLQPILHLIGRYADTLGIVCAQASLAYIRCYLPDDAEWTRAAYAIVRLRQQHPNHYDVVFVYDAVRGKDNGARTAEFDRIAATVQG